jgi:hypothetical protein
MVLVTWGPLILLFVVCSGDGVKGMQGISPDMRSPHDGVQSIHC